MNPRSKEELLTKHLGGKHGDGGAFIKDFLDFSGNIDFHFFSTMHGQKQIETGTVH